VNARRSRDGVYREHDRSLLFDAEDAPVRVAKEPVYHRGVLRTAGVRHVGRAHIRASLFVRDAHAYDRCALGEIDVGLERIREACEKADECARRSWVCAVADLARWLSGDTSRGGAP
jgi:hypothetical protein